MDTYIVRIYRNSSKSSDEVAGQVEEVGSDKRRSFQTMSGLVDTLRHLLGRNAPHHANMHERYPEKAWVNTK
jgi:hypothetical protein